MEKNKFIMWIIISAIVGALVQKLMDKTLFAHEKN